MDICCVFGKDMGDREETLVENGLNQRSTSRCWNYSVEAGTFKSQAYSCSLELSSSLFGGSGQVNERVGNKDQVCVSR